jgi:hypothetical protein
MKIHGVRIYPDSVDVVQGEGGPMYIRGSVTEECSDFFYIFRGIAALWRGHFFAVEYMPSLDDRGKLADPMPGLREQFGSSLVSVDRQSQLMVLRGDEFLAWGTKMYFVEGALLAIFREAPNAEVLERVYRSRNFRLTSDTWPAQMRAVMHMWDDIYWQLFSTESSDIDTLIRAHLGDAKLNMYFVEVDREYPDPSNGELAPATVSA